MYHSPYTEAQVNEMPLIMAFLNKYTNKWVGIYRHPSDIRKVVTMAHPCGPDGRAVNTIPNIRVVWREVAEWFIGKLPDGC